MRVVPIRFGRPEFLGTKSNFENAGKQTGARVQRELAELFVSGQKKEKKTRGANVLMRLRPIDRAEQSTRAAKRT